MLPLWADLASHLSCRLGASVSIRLAACLVPSAPLGGLGGLCPMAGVGDLWWKERRGVGGRVGVRDSTMKKRMFISKIMQIDGRIMDK